MKEELVIIGASGHGKVVANIALNLNKWKKISFLDDNDNLKTCMGLEVNPRGKDPFKFIGRAQMFVAIGNNSTRKKILEALIEKGANIATIIDKTAVIGRDVKIGEGSIVMPGAIINCCTSIGKACIINTASTIDHDSILGNYVHISPGSHLCGSVTVGNSSWLGAGTIVSNNIKICDDTIVGAGGLVVRDIDISGTYVGVPVRRI